MEKVSQLRGPPFASVLGFPTFRGFVNRGQTLKVLGHKILFYLFSVYGDRFGTLFIKFLSEISISGSLNPDYTFFDRLSLGTSLSCFQQ